MERLTNAMPSGQTNFTENQQRMAFMGGAALFGAASAFYLARKAFGASPSVEEEKCDLP